MAPPTPDGERQRLDLWLWHARIVRTRSAAAELLRAGHVRLDGRRVATAAHPVRRGQVLTISLTGGVRVVRVSGFSERRGNATSVADLFEDITRDISE